MLQTSKLTVIEHDANGINENHINQFDPMEKQINDDPNALPNQEIEKNPIINKRILLKVNDLDSQFPPPDVDGNLDDDLNGDAVKPLHEAIKINKSESIEANEIRDKIIFDKMRLSKSLPDTMAGSTNDLINDINNPMAERQPSTEGRIVVYGDSNCLDSTHTEKEKSCFWLLDALLEYTMTSHISSLLKDLNRSSNIRFDSNINKMPKRLPNNNLHMYSKVLMPMTVDEDLSAVDQSNKSPMPLLKRSRPECKALLWEIPIFLNISAPNDFQYLNGHREDSDADASNMVEELNSRRKLESQKGEVCSVCLFL